MVEQDWSDDLRCVCEVIRWWSIVSWSQLSRSTINTRETEDHSWGEQLTRVCHSSCIICLCYPSNTEICWLCKSVFFLQEFNIYWSHMFWRFMHFHPLVIISENKSEPNSLSRWKTQEHQEAELSDHHHQLVTMMLTNSSSVLPVMTPDTVSIQPIINTRVKPLETQVTGLVTSSPLVTSAPATQSLQEVSIHKTVIPPRTLSPPLCPPSLCRPSSASPSQPSLLTHPREGQSASLLGGKYILLDELEGSTLHRCLDISSQEELVCKVSEMTSR